MLMPVAIVIIYSSVSLFVRSTASLSAAIDNVGDCLVAGLSVEDSQWQKYIILQ